MISELPKTRVVGVFTQPRPIRDRSESDPERSFALIAIRAIFLRPQRPQSPARAGADCPVRRLICICRLLIGADITRVSSRGPRGAPARPVIPHDSCGPRPRTHPTRRSLRAAGDMRSEYHALQGGEAIARRPRLHGVRIEARAGDRACFQRFVQRVLVDQPATARIDEKGAGSHGGEERTVREPRVLWDVGDARRTDAASVQPTAIESAIPFFIVLLHSGRTTYLRRLLAALVQLNHVARHSRAIEPAISNPGSDLGSNSSFFLLSTCPRKITVSMSRVSAMW